MKEEILVFIHSQGEVRYTDIIEHFVKGRECSKATLLKYKGELEAEGKVKKKLDEKTGRPVYYLTAEASSEAKVYISAQAMTNTPLKTLKVLSKSIFQPIQKLEETLGPKKMEQLLSGYTGLRRFLAKPTLQAVSESMSGIILSDLEIDEAYLSKAALELAKEYSDLIHPLIAQRMDGDYVHLNTLFKELTEGTNVPDDMANLLRRLQERFSLEEIQDILTGEELSSKLSSEERHLVYIRLKRFVKELWERHSKWISEQEGFQVHVMLSFDGSMMLRNMSKILEKMPEDVLMRETLGFLIARAKTYVNSHNSYALGKEHESAYDV